MIFAKNGPTRITKFKNRQEAGLVLAEKLKQLKLGKNTIVCAIPRGGVVVGAAIAKILKLPLTAFPIKKISAPANPELAVGAVSTFGEPFFDKPLIKVLEIPKSYLDSEVERLRLEVQKREVEYGIEKYDFKNKTVVITDDGVATGATMTLVANLISGFQVKRLILAVPVTPKKKVLEFKNNFDQIISILQPADFRAVGQFYYDFPQVTDEQVKRILKSKNQK